MYNGTKGIIEKFCDGNTFQNYGVFSGHPQALQVLMYFDEFKVTNALTSRMISIGRCYFPTHNFHSIYERIEIILNFVGCCH